MLLFLFYLVLGAGDYYILETDGGINTGETLCCSSTMNEQNNVLAGTFDNYSLSFIFSCIPLTGRYKPFSLFLLKTKVLYFHTYRV